MGTTNKLTNVACSAPFVVKLKHDGKPRAFEKRSDGDGLFLQVQPDGRRFWRLKYRASGRERLAGFGEYPKVTLAEARKRREEYLTTVRNGGDPIAAKKAARVAGAASTTKAQRSRTLEGYATKYHEEVADEFKNAKHRAQWLSSLKPVFAKLGARDLAEITQRDLIDALRPIFKATPETGRRVRQQLADAFSAAVDDGLIPASPAAALNSKKTRKRTGEPKLDATKHLAAMPFQDVPAFVVALRVYGERLRDTGQSMAARYALEFALLTASRTGEVLGMVWKELSADGTTWVIDGERMKAGQAHTVYLSEPARAILRTMRELTGGKGYVFPSPVIEDAPLSNMTMLQILRRMPTGQTRADGQPQHYSDISTVHGACRACFSSWAYSTNAARGDAIEAALAHREKDRIKAAYAHQTDLATERRKLAAAWARYCTSAPREKIIPFERRRAGK